MKFKMSICLVFASVTLSLHGVRIINATEATEIIVGGTNYYNEGRRGVVERWPMSPLLPGDELDVRLREMTVRVHGCDYRFIGLSGDTVITISNDNYGGILVERSLKNSFEHYEN